MHCNYYREFENVLPNSGHDSGAMVSHRCELEDSGEGMGVGHCKASHFIDLEQEAVADYLAERSALTLKIAFFVEQAIPYDFCASSN
jgi:hypothetical protein